MSKIFVCDFIKTAVLRNLHVFSYTHQLKKVQFIVPISVLSYSKSDIQTQFEVNKSRTVLQFNLQIMRR